MISLYNPHFPHFKRFVNRPHARLPGTARRGFGGCNTGRITKTNTGRITMRNTGRFTIQRAHRDAPLPFIESGNFLLIKTILSRRVFFAFIPFFEIQRGATMADNITLSMSQKSERSLKRAAEITAILVGIFTIITILANLVNQQLPPRFEFAFTGVVNADQPAYEVTAALARGGEQDTTLQMIVNATYSGERIKGPVVVEVQTRSGRLIEVARWSEFQSMHSQTRLVEFSLSDLYRYAELSKDRPAPNPAGDDPFAGARGEVRVNVRHYNQVLATATFQVANAPWLHALQVSSSSIHPGQPVTAYVTVHNHGDPARFFVQAELYEIFPGRTAQLAPTLIYGDGGWLPSQTWHKQVFKTHAELAEPVPTGGRAVASIVLPAEQFQSKRVYLLDTVVIKKLPYLNFMDGDWISSPDAWRASADRQMAVIVVVE
jgi:hypothetical protein